MSPADAPKSGDGLGVPQEHIHAAAHEDSSQTRLIAAKHTRWRVTDGSDIAAVFSLLSAVRASGMVRFEHNEEYRCGYDAPTFAELVPGPRLLLGVGSHADGLDGTWHVELEGPYSLITFELAPENRLASGRFRLPQEIECIYRRSERRVLAPPGTTIRIKRRPGDEWLERPLRDIGASGLQFNADPHDGFTEGEQFFSAEVSWKHGRSVSLLAEVRHVRRDADQALGCGVSIIPQSAEDSVAWQHEVSGLLHPETTDAKYVPPQKIWELYEASGYFGLDGRDSADFVHLKTAFDEASAKLAQVPQLSCRVVREISGQIEASISLLRCWSSAWLAYQIARRQHGTPLMLSGNGVLREMYEHAYETMLRHTGSRWQVAYIRKDARFSHLAFRRFALSHLDERQVAIVPFRAMQIYCEDIPALPAQSPNIGCARETETGLVLAALAQRFPPPYLEAYDYVEGRFHLAEIGREWSQGKLLRSRALAVARERGVPVAAAILDMAEPGVHLVGLLDSVHIVALTVAGVRRFSELLQYARHYYHEHGRKEFVLFEETGDPSYALALGARDMGQADQIFVSASLTPEFLDHISHVTAPRRVPRDL